MACNTCNTPASSGGNLPAPKKAYLTDPATSPAERCGSAPVDPCSPQTSKRRYLSDYIPGWLQRLTPAPMGRLLIGVGSVLHYFKGRNAGPLFFDGENVTVGAQPTLTAAANPESVHERGHLTLAKKVRRPQVMPDGTVADLDFYEFGVQALGEIERGHLAGLTIDRTSGQARIDAVRPVEVDMVKRGMPCKFRRLGYATEEIDGGCGKVDVERFYSYRGAVYGDDEIAKDQIGGIPAVLIPVQSECGDVHYRIATPKDGVVPGGFAVGEAHSEEDIEAEYAAFGRIAVRWEGEDGTPMVSYKDGDGNWLHYPMWMHLVGSSDTQNGIEAEFESVGPCIVHWTDSDNYRWKSTKLPPSGIWDHDPYGRPMEQEIAPVLVYNETGAGSSFVNVVSLASLPDGVRYAKVAMQAGIFSTLSGRPVATLRVNTQFGGTEEYIVQHCQTDDEETGVTISSIVADIPIRPDGTIQFQATSAGGTVAGWIFRAKVIGYKF